MIEHFGLASQIPPSAAPLALVERRQLPGWDAIARPGTLLARGAA